MNELLLQKREELHPDLKPYLMTTGGRYSSIPCIQHPLVYSLFHTPEQNALINAQYESKLRLVKKAKRTKDFHSFVFLHERPYRLPAFAEIERTLPDLEYWALLSDIYTDSENIWQHKAKWMRYLASPRSHSEAFMNPAEQQHLASLPENLTVFRGYIPNKNSVGWSYSLNEDTAKWFATRFNRKGKVKTLLIPKSIILAYKACREEHEIVLRRPR